MKYISRLKSSSVGKMAAKITKPIRKRRYNTKRILRYSIVVAVLLILGSSYIAYTRLYLTPERRFWSAITNNLATSSVMRETQTGGTGNKNIEKTRFEFGSQATQNKISSVSLKNATSESNVTTESILTPNTQYVRYTNVFSSEKKPDGTSYNFDAIKNVWAKQDSASTDDAKDRLRLGYIQPLITLAPFGNFTAAQRSTLVAKLKSIGAYDTDFNHVTYSDFNGRHYVMYDVKVQTKKYVVVLQDYLNELGLGSFPPLDPTNYPDNARVNASFVVDLRDNTLSAITYNGQDEHYSDYGVHNQVKEPATSISLTELQDRLQSAQ